MQPGVTEAAAQAELNVAAQQLAHFYGDPDRQQKGQRVLLLGGGKILPLRKQDVPFFRQFLLVLGGLLLLIACANIANMMLARAADREGIITCIYLGGGSHSLFSRLLRPFAYPKLRSKPSISSRLLPMLRRCQSTVSTTRTG